MRCIEEFETVQRLIAAGVNDCAIARQTGIPRCTVRDWRLRRPIRPRPISTSGCGRLHEFAAFPQLPIATYSAFIWATDVSRDAGVCGA